MLNKEVIRPFLKTLHTMLENFWWVSSLPFIGSLLGGRGCLLFSPRNSSKRPVFWICLGWDLEHRLLWLIASIENYCRWGNVTLLVQLNVSAAFATIDHGILLGHFSARSKIHHVMVVRVLSERLVPEGGAGEFLLCLMVVGLWGSTVFHLISHAIQYLYEATGSIHEEAWAAVSPICRWYLALPFFSN